MVVVLLVLASFSLSIILAAVVVTVLGDLIQHRTRGTRGLPTCRRALDDLTAVARATRPALASTVRRLDAKIRSRLRVRTS